jgi:hypothetical protein
MLPEAQSPPAKEKPGSPLKGAVTISCYLAFFFAQVKFQMTSKGILASGVSHLYLEIDERRRA